MVARASTSIVLAVPVVAVFVVGCGASGGESLTPRAPIVGNAAVRARMASLPEPTFAASTEIRAASMEDLRAYCAWQARAIGSYDVEAACRDGSQVRIATACGEEDLEAMHEGMAICALTIGEWAACVAARREEPCEGGVFGERLPECEAFAGCIAAAMEEGDGAAVP
jgi:hypothetical protein